MTIFNIKSKHDIQRQQFIVILYEAYAQM